MKDFYLKIRFYSEINNSPELLTDPAEKIEDGDKEVNLIEDRAEICKRVVKKYIHLCQDNRKNAGTLELIKSCDITYALKNLNFIKATG